MWLAAIVRLRSPLELSMKTTLPLAFILTAPAAFSQSPTCLLQEGGALAGETVSSLSNTAVNQQGGFAVTTNTTDGVSTRSRVWGSSNGSAVGVLQTEATIGTYEQTAFESFFGVAGDGTVAYSATVTDTVSGVSSLDSAWLGDVPLAVQGEPIPSLPGQVWRFASRVGVTDDGQPWWVAGINSASGVNEGAGWFFGTGATPIYRTGDMLTGISAPLDSSPVDFDSRFSALGRHHIAALNTTGVAAPDVFVAIDGAALEVGGGVVGEALACLAVGALPGESWDNLDSLGINDRGDWFFSGDTDAAFGVDEILCKNGEILYREGDLVDGVTLTGAMEGAFMDETGTLAYVWDYVGTGGDLEALFIDDRLVLSEGDAVDFDGDGVVDPGAVIANFTGITSMRLAADRVVYVTADIDTLGTSSTIDDTECLIAVTDPAAPDLIATPPQVFLDTGGKQNLFVRAPQSSAGELYWVLGSISGTAPGIVIDGFLVPLNPDAYFIHTLTKANQAPLTATFGTLDSSAKATASFTIGAAPGPAFVGLQLDHAYIAIDVVGLFVEHASAAAGLSLTL